MRATSYFDFRSKSAGTGPQSPPVYWFPGSSLGTTLPYWFPGSSLGTTLPYWFPGPSLGPTLARGSRLALQPRPTWSLRSSSPTSPTWSPGPPWDHTTARLPPRLSPQFLAADKHG